jgi:phospholipase C
VGIQLRFDQVASDITALLKLTGGVMNRQIIYGIITLAGMGLALGSPIAFAEGDLHKVNHIIIVMQENHSFDNYFGARGLRPQESLSQRQWRVRTKR